MPDAGRDQVGMGHHRKVLPVSPLVPQQKGEEHRDHAGEDREHDGPEDEGGHRPSDSYRRHPVRQARWKNLSLPKHALAQRGNGQLGRNQKRPSQHQTAPQEAWRRPIPPAFI